MRESITQQPISVLCTTKEKCSNLWAYSKKVPPSPPGGRAPLCCILALELPVASPLVWLVHESTSGCTAPFAPYHSWEQHQHVSFLMPLVFALPLILSFFQTKCKRMLLLLHNHGYCPPCSVEVTGFAFKNAPSPKKALPSNQCCFLCMLSH